MSNATRLKGIKFSEAYAFLYFVGSSSLYNRAIIIIWRELAFCTCCLDNVPLSENDFSRKELRRNN